MDLYCCLLGKRPRAGDDPPVWRRSPFSVFVGVGGGLLSLSFASLCSLRLVPGSLVVSLLFLYHPLAVRPRLAVAATAGNVRQAPAPPGPRCRRALARTLPVWLAAPARGGRRGRCRAMGLPPRPAAARPVPALRLSTGAARDGARHRAGCRTCALPLCAHGHGHNHSRWLSLKGPRSQENKHATQMPLLQVTAHSEQQAVETNIKRRSAVEPQERSKEGSGN